jgi:hypothetical protein
VKEGIVMFLASVITPLAVTVKDTIADTRLAVQGRTKLFPASAVSDRPNSLIQAHVYMGLKIFYLF